MLYILNELEGKCDEKLSAGFYASCNKPENHARWMPQNHLWFISKYTPPEKAFVEAKKSKREVISRLKRAKSIRIRSIL